MIVFSALRTKRMTLQLKELAIQDAIYLCKMPVIQFEQATTECIRRIIGKTDDKVGLVSDPLDMSIQERGFIVAHYLAHTGDQPNFPIESGNFSDYIYDAASEPVVDLKLGEFNGDDWIFRFLTGRHSESIERLILSDRLPSGFEGWLFGAMAAALTTETSDEQDLSEMIDDNVDEIILTKAQLFQAMPETDFHQMVAMFFRGLNATGHLLKVAISKDGFVFESTSKEVEGLPPVRFPVDTCIGQRTKNLFGQVDQ